MNLYEGLGYTLLLPSEQQAYKIILAAFSTMATSFSISKIHPTVDLMKIVNCVLGDNPNVVYFNKTRIETIESGLGQQIELTGTLPKSRVEKMDTELKEKTEQFASSIKSGITDDYTLLLKTYKYLQQNVRYDKQELASMSNGKSKNPLSHNAYGALVSGLAVCDGYSSAFTLLARKLGYESMLIVGESLLRPGVTVKHSWNIVKVKDRYYHMDVTWDAKKYHEFGGFSYSYFAVSDSEIATDHDWGKSNSPSCAYNDLSYFIKNGLIANNIGQCGDIVRTSIRKRDDFIRLRLSNDIILPENTEDNLLQQVMMEARNNGISKRFEYYWNEQTRCYYLKFL